jgi:hypothetical protein
MHIQPLSIYSEQAQDRVTVALARLKTSMKCNTQTTAVVFAMKNAELHPNLQTYLFNNINE